MENKPVLSITLLASNRPDTIPKCLSSLKHLLESIPSELIILDTGCDEITKSILYQFTENVYPFSWCADFAKARNAALEKASGQWFMTIDDDEWFIDTDAIEQFFLSGEYLKYDTAYYFVRNYHDYQEKYFTDSVAQRLFKLLPQTHFEGRVHEYVEGVSGNRVIQLDSYAKHFGYVYETVEEHTLHSQRNISLNQKMIEEEPDELRWTVQLIREYFAVEEYLLGVELATKCAERIQYSTDKYDNVVYGGLLSSILYGVHCGRDSLCTIEAFEGMELTSHVSNISRGYCNGIVAEDYFEEKRYLEALTCCDTYFNVYEMYGDELSTYIFLDTSLNTEAYDEARIHRNATLGFLASIALEKEEHAQNYFTRMQWEQPAFVFYEDFFPKLLSIIEVKQSNRVAISYLQKILDYEEGKYNFAFTNSLKKCFCDGILLDEMCNEMQVDLEAVLFGKFVYAWKKQHVDVLERFTAFWEKLSDVFAYGTLLFEIVEDCKIDLKQFVDEISDADFYTFSVKKYIINTAELAVEKLEQIENNHYFQGTKARKLHMLLSTVRFKNDPIESNYKSFLSAVSEVYATVYTMSISSVYKALLPLELRAALKGSLTECLKTLSGEYVGNITTEEKTVEWRFLESEILRKNEKNLAEEEQLLFSLVKQYRSSDAIDLWEEKKSEEYQKPQWWRAASLAYYYGKQYENAIDCSQKYLYSYKTADLRDSFGEMVFSDERVYEILIVSVLSAIELEQDCAWILELDLPLNCTKAVTELVTKVPQKFLSSLKSEMNQTIANASMMILMRDVKSLSAFVAKVVLDDEINATMLYGISVSLHTLPLELVSGAFVELIDGCEGRSLSIVRTFIEETIAEDEELYFILMSRLALKIFQSRTEDTFEKQEEYIRLFVTYELQVAERMLTPDFQETELQLMPRIMLALCLQEFMLENQQCNYKNAIQVLGSCIGISPDYDDAIVSFAHNYADEVQEWLKDENERVFYEVRSMLLQHPTDYLSYLRLGGYYEKKNLLQTYLCYENAAYYCTDPIVKKDILATIKAFNDNGIFVPPTSIVILSYNLLEDTKQCIESIRNTTSEVAREIVVVDNASQDGSVEYLKEQSDIVLVENKENRGFPGGCNDGILASSPANDILLLNNDTIMTPNALFWLRMGLYNATDIGMSGAVSNYVSNLQMELGEIVDIELLEKKAEEFNVPNRAVLEEKTYLVGFALLAKRSALNQVGMLDERFFPGNCEDDDLGLRMLEAGFKNVLCHNSYIIHLGSKSFKKKGDNYSDLLRVNRLKLNEKWKFATIEKTIAGEESVLHYLWETKLKPDSTVVEVECGVGTHLRKLRYMYPKMQLFGVEENEKCYQLASVGNVATFCKSEKELATVLLPYSVDLLLVPAYLWKAMSTEQKEKYHSYLTEAGELLIGQIFEGENVSKLMENTKWVLINENYIQDGSGYAVFK